MFQKTKKLVAVLATFTLMTGKKREEELKQIPYIWYPVTFKDQTEALLDSKSEINAISLVFASQLGFRIQKINVGVQKIDNITLETDGMVVSIFFLLDKDDQERFFKESFLLADIKPDSVLAIPFLTMSNANVNFQARNL